MEVLTVQERQEDQKQAARARGRMHRLSVAGAKALRTLAEAGATGAAATEALADLEVRIEAALSEGGGEEYRDPVRGQRAGEERTPLQPGVLALAQHLHALLVERQQPWLQQAAAAFDLPPSPHDLTPRQASDWLSNLCALPGHGGATLRLQRVTVLSQGEVASPCMLQPGEAGMRQLGDSSTVRGLLQPASAPPPDERDGQGQVDLHGVVGDLTLRQAARVYGLRWLVSALLERGGLSQGWAGVVEAAGRLRTVIRAARGALGLLARASPLQHLPSHVRLLPRLRALSLLLPRCCCLVRARCRCHCCCCCAAALLRQTCVCMTCLPRWRTRCKAPRRGSACRRWQWSCRIWASSAPPTLLPRPCFTCAPWAACCCSSRGGEATVPRLVTHRRRQPRCVAW